MDTLVVVGVGLIGSSVGLAAGRRGVVRRVVGVDRNRARLERALALGAVDEGADDLRAARQADAVIVCTPVHQVADLVREAAACCKPGALLTDTGSTKAAIVEQVGERLPPGVAFVGGHPLAGSEKNGPEHADADLFQDRVTVLTPTARTQREAVRRLTDFWQALGARVRLLSPEEHDRALALTSHLPHLAASALAGLLPPDLAELTATGFRDTTRVASGDTALWTAIFAQNRPAVLDALGLLQDRLIEFKRALLVNDPAVVQSLLDQAKRVRDALGS